MADEKKTYTLTTATVPSRPRSKTRREGEGLTTGGASAIVESATAGNAQRAAHSETANEAAHAAEAAHALNADNAKNATHADEATHAAHAETATSATTAAHSNTADTATRAQSAQTADHAATAATAERATHATEAETLRTPNYSDGLTTGAGARIDAMGNAEFQSMAVRGFFRAAEYQINRIALSEGDVFHTENGLVKSAEQQADGRWKVVLQERFQGDVTSFRAGDILRGAYNGIGTSGGAAEIRTSWLRVEAVDAKAGTLTASLYADNQTPEGRNAPPVSLMRLARWGNTTDPERQSHIVESATDGRIVRRVKVSAPIVDGAQSDGFVVGKLPAWLREHFGAAVADASDYVFARGIITQNILRYTPAGRPLAERVDRGLWSASSRYFYEEQNPETGAFEISRVWHDGALYELARGGNGNTAPAANSTHWTLIQAKPKDGRDGDAGKSAPPTGANLIDGTSFRSMEDVRNWKDFERFAFNQSQEDKVHPLAQAVSSHKNETWTQGILYIASLLRPNTTYTLSVYSKGAPGKLVFWFLSNATNRDTLCANLDPKKWTRYAYTFTTPDTIPDGVRIMLRCMDHDAKTYFSALKLEEGETATPWCLSENDKMATPAANPNLWHCTDYVTRPHFTKGYLDGKTYASILPGGVDGDNYFHVEGNGEERYTHVWWEKFGDLYPRGTWYTFSFKCRGSGNALFGCYPMHGKQRYFFPRIKRNGVLQVWGKQLVLSIPLTDTWTTYSLSVFYDAPEDDLPKTLWTFFKLLKSEGNYLDICHPKMETGEFATPWCLSEMDKKGEKGTPGKDGKSSYTHVAYSNSPNGNPCTLDPKGEKFAYLGTYTDETSDASTDPARYVWAKVQGDKGDKGRGIERVETFYLLTTENTAPNHNTQGWTTKAPMPTPQKPWLWNYERTVYSDRVEEPTAVRLIGHYGKDGTNGTSIRAQYSADAQTWHDDFAEGDVWMRTGNGTTWGGVLRVVGESGADGKSPVYDFAASSQLATASGTTAPTIRGTWQDAPPTLRDGEVLWYRLTAANGKITYGRLSGEKGKPGVNGSTSYIHMAYANSANGEKDFTLEENLGRNSVEDFLYFGIYSDFEGRASRSPSDYTWTRLRGEDGLAPNPNLLDGTNFESRVPWATFNVSESAYSFNGKPTQFGYSQLAEGQFRDLLVQEITSVLKVGQTYTFSAWMQARGTLTWIFSGVEFAESPKVNGVQTGDASGSGRIPNNQNSVEFEKVTVSFKVNRITDARQYFYIRAWDRSSANIVDPKLEVGKIATPWCPSERDLRADYRELRFAVNGSPTQPPAISSDRRTPDGWNIAQPVVGVGQYLWMTSAMVSRYETALLDRWSTPTRITPEDGKNGRDGEAPAMVYRGVWDASKEYYGTKHRRDAVFYEGAYYIARTDAGTFRGVAPTDKSKWNDFGASFESVATQLLLAEHANVGRWILSNGNLVSDLDDTRTHIKLDARENEVWLHSAYIEDKPKGAESSSSDIVLKASSGGLGTHAVFQKDRTSYHSQCGVAWDGISSDIEYVPDPRAPRDERREAISGRMTRADNGIAVGVAGYAINQGDGEAFGGYFVNLKALGLVVGLKRVGEQNNNAVSLNLSDTRVVGLHDNFVDIDVRLPAKASEGQTIVFTQVGRGTMKILPPVGESNHRFGNDSERILSECSVNRSKTVRLTLLRNVNIGNERGINLWIVEE